MKHLLIPGILVLVLSGCQPGSKTLPTGSVSLIDRQLDQKEWKTAEVISLNDSVVFKAMQDENHLYLSIDFQEQDSSEYRWVEIYIDTNTDILRLHASGQLGQQLRSEQEQAWNDEWLWGNNEHWQATKHGLNTRENQGYEFSLEKKLFDQLPPRVMVVSFIADKTQGFNHPPAQLTFPEMAKDNTPAGWHQLRLD